MLQRNNNSIGNHIDIKAGVYGQNEFHKYIVNGCWFGPTGQQEYTTAGTFTWVCPQDVESVCVVCVGGGGGGAGTWANAAGGGGALAYINDYSVNPGSSYTVVVGTGGQTNTSGADSYFGSTSVVLARGGYHHGYPANTGVNGSNNGSGGGWTGDGGGAGGNSNSWTGGGGAGGYSGDGGAAGGNASSGTGAGAGGTGYSSTYGSGAGGGVGIYGRRTDYTALAGYGYGANTAGGALVGTLQKTSSYTSGCGGEGGSTRTGIISGITSGCHGCNGQNAVGYGANPYNIWGGWPGGGGGGPGTSYGGGGGAYGAVRIIWGYGRSFPDTNTEDIS